MALVLQCVITANGPNPAPPPCPDGYTIAAIDQPTSSYLTGDEWGFLAAKACAFLIVLWITSKLVGNVIGLFGRSVN